MNEWAVDGVVYVPDETVELTDVAAQLRWYDGLYRVDDVLVIVDAGKATPVKVKP